jgi:hypothetical protein
MMWLRQNRHKFCPRRIRECQKIKKNQNVVGLHDANHGFMIVSSPPSHKGKQRNCTCGPQTVVDGRRQYWR